MLPLIINSRLDRLVQVTMRGSVGAGGINDRNDVVLVQSVLNATTFDEGGPQRNLTVDGVVGPVTTAAIRRYQQMRTRVTDGRVDPHGATIKSLMTALISRGALPPALPNVGTPDEKFVRALSGTTPMPAHMSRNELFPSTAPPAVAPAFSGREMGAKSFSSSLYTGATGWKFKSSSGLAAAIDIVGVAVINIYLTHDLEPGLTYRFAFAGAGVGLSTMPIGLDWSSSDMPSYGTDLWKVNPLLGKAPPIMAGDLDLLPTTVVAAGANAGPGWSGLAICWGTLGLGPQAVLTRYMNLITGMQAGIPGAGITMFVGAIAGWT